MSDSMATKEALRAIGLKRARRFPGYIGVRPALLTPASATMCGVAAVAPTRFLNNGN